MQYDREEKTETRNGPVTPASKWQIEAMQQIDLLSELRAETMQMNATFDKVLEPARPELVKEGEKNNRADSEVVEHLRESNDIIRDIISIVKSIKVRSQV